MFYVLYNYIIKNSYEQSHFDIPNFKPNTKGDELIFFKENINLAGLIPEIIVFDSRNTFCSPTHKWVRFQKQYNIRWDLLVFKTQCQLLVLIDGIKTLPRL